jgi:hypothetical protein
MSGLEVEVFDMTPSHPGERHEKRFARWQARVNPRTRFLSELVKTELVPVFEAEGLGTVDIALEGKGRTLNPNEIRLERLGENHIDSIDITFGKYGQTKFQISASRRQRVAPNNWIRSTCLVKHARQYYCFWGKPWWLPGALWTDALAKRTVNTLLKLVRQLAVFLETGERGPNLSRPSAGPD